MFSIVREPLVMRCMMCSEFNPPNYEWFVITCSCGCRVERRLCLQCIYSS